MAEPVRGVFHARLTLTHGRMFNMSLKKEAEQKLRRKREK
jgi:hypothetical protein